MGFARSPFRDFECYLIIVVGLDEKDLQLILKQYNSFFFFYEISLGIYTIRDNSEVVYTMGAHGETLKIEYDDITMKTKFIWTRFGSAIGRIRFDENSIFKKFIGFTPYWDYKPIIAIHADDPGDYTGDKNLILITKEKIHFKCEVIDGSIVDGLRQPVLYSFILDKPAGYKCFRQPETIHYKKVNKFVLNTKIFYLEVFDCKEVNFKQKKLTFTLRLIRI